MNLLKASKIEPIDQRKYFKWLLLSIDRVKSNQYQITMLIYGYYYQNYHDVSGWKWLALCFKD